MQSPILLVLAAAAFAQSSPQDYPQWRGTTRDGSASGFVMPKSWPESLTRRWKVDVGEGYATPLVIGSAVYAFTRRNGREGITAIDAASGKLLWRTDYAAPYQMLEPTKAHGEGPKATPLFHRGKLYTVGIAGIVSAFDAAGGKLLWQRPAPPAQPAFGTAVSPVGDGNLVVVHVGDEGRLTALNAGTGEVQWTCETGGAAFASPIIAEIDGVRHVVTVTLESVVGVSLKDGALLWKYPWAPKSTPSATTPVLFGRTILVSGQEMGIAALAPARREGKWIVERVWATNEVSLFLSNPVLIGDTLFGMSHRANGQYFALDAGSGKVLWLGAPRVASNTAIVKAGGLLFLLNDNGELIVAQSSRTGFEPLKRYKVADAATWAQPAISGKRIFVKDVGSLALWTFD